MGIVFNAEEILKIAEKIEENGIVFYQSSASRFDDPASRKLLLELADMEEGHKAIFSKMRENLPEEQRKQTTFDPDGLLDEYLKAFADGYIFPIDLLPEQALETCKSLQDVLDFAIQREKDSVVFYLGLKDIVPEALGKDKIDKIIREEMSHITLLSKRKAEIIKSM